MTATLLPLRQRIGSNEARRMPLSDRLWSGAVEDEHGCWVWQRCKSGLRGYAQMSYNDRLLMVHRIAYELAVGPIPVGLVIDHLCRNHSCINPEHLEPVTNVENVMRGESAWARNARKTHCKRGHEFTDENTIRRNGTRSCRQCRSMKGRATMPDPERVKRGRNSKERGKQDERDVAAIVGGRRHPADSGGPEDVEHPTLAIQVKGGITAASVVLKTGMAAAKLAAEGTGKLAALVLVDRSGPRLKRYICFDLEDWQARQ